MIRESSFANVVARCEVSNIAPKRLQDCMLSVELEWHIDEQVE